MPVTEKALKDGLIKILEEHCKVLEGQKRRMPFGDNRDKVCEAYKKFGDGLVEIRKQMVTFAKEHKVERLESIVSDLNFDPSSESGFYEDVMRFIYGKKKRFFEDTRPTTDEKLKSWFENQFWRVLEGKGRKVLLSDSLTQFCKDIKKVAIKWSMSILKEVSEKYKKTDRAAIAPEVDQHFKTSYISDLKNLSQQLKSKIPNPIDVTFDGFKEYKKIVRDKIVPIAKDAFWLESHFLGNELGDVYLRILDDICFDDDDGFPDIRNRFKIISVRYSEKINKYVEKLKELIKKTKKWKPIDTD